MQWHLFTENESGWQISALPWWMNDEYLPVVQVSETMKCDGTCFSMLLLLLLLFIVFVCFCDLCIYIILWDHLIINQYYAMILTDHVVIINIIRQFLDTFINQNTWLIGWQFTAITTSKYYKIEQNLTLNDVFVHIKKT